MCAGGAATVDMCVISSVYCIVLRLNGSSSKALDFTHIILILIRMTLSLEHIHLVAKAGDVTVLLLNAGKYNISCGVWCCPI